jgi:hypothetical protein
MTEIRIGHSEEECMGICRFRYEVYVEELGKTPGCANHVEKMLREPLDAVSLLFYAAQGAEVIGTVRWTPEASLRLPSKLRQVFELARFANVFAPEQLSFTSRLMIAADWRQSLVAGRLVQELYRNACDRGVLLDFIHVTPTLVPLYRHLGYRRYASCYLDEEVGLQVPMVLALQDATHLRAVRSPFHRLATVRGHDPGAWQWVSRMFPGARRPQWQAPQPAEELEPVLQTG